MKEVQESVQVPAQDKWSFVFAAYDWEIDYSFVVPEEDDPEPRRKSHSGELVCSGARYLR